MVLPMGREICKARGLHSLPPLRENFWSLAKALSSLEGTAMDPVDPCLQYSRVFLLSELTSPASDGHILSLRECIQSGGASAHLGTVPSPAAGSVYL